MSTSGNTVVIDAPIRDSGNSGSAYVIEKSLVDGASTWPHMSKLVFLGTTDGGLFGRAVSIDGDTIVVGARDDADVGTPVNPGSVCVLVRDATDGTWVQTDTLGAFGGLMGGHLGSSVETSGNIIVVGAYKL